MKIRSTGEPNPDGALNTAAQIKNRHYKRIYAELPKPVVFLPVTASTSGRINEETIRLLFLHANTRLVRWLEKRQRSLLSFVSFGQHV